MTSGEYGEKWGPEDQRPPLGSLVEKFVLQRTLSFLYTVASQPFCHPCFL